ncbi:Os01g0562450 [Oryza sativa Japonica Group]|uniref:Os01g0562450 protein n=1 Tax=Oryza sativa subsp. japonica TaxID=39947 RepID=A0A0N7KD62_ORYSJ|nr:Os01g0562450 [Oryza sativa Japonica Group]
MKGLDWRENGGAVISLASSHLTDLRHAGGASPTPLPRRIRRSSASGALAAARSALSPWPDPARLPSSFLLKPTMQASDAVLEAASEIRLLGHSDNCEAVNDVLVRAN